MAKLNGRQINWAIQRMRHILKVWARLDSADRYFLLSKFRDDHPEEFWGVAQEKAVCRAKAS